MNMTILKADAGARALNAATPADNVNLHVKIESFSDKRDFIP